MTETTAPDSVGPAMPAVTSVTHYISVVSWLEMIAVGVALIAVLWAYRRHRQAATAMMAAGLLLLLGRYGVAAVLLNAELQLRWAFTAANCAGALSILLIAGGCVLQTCGMQRPGAISADSRGSQSEGHVL